MAYYTITLGELIERGYPIALQQYPIFNEEHRSELNQKIIDHFWFREIGAETPDRFNFYLRRKLNEIMPYYNQLFFSETLEFDPLATDYTEEKILDNFTGLNTSQGFNKNFRSAKDDTTFSDKTISDNINNLTHNIHDGTQGEYQKSGDKTIDFHSDQNETTTEHISTNALRTDNLKTDENSSTTSDENRSTTSSSTKIFSDLPQAGTETTQTVAPDGTTTITTKGYATTSETVSASEKMTDHVDNSGERHSTNTGTVENDGTSDLNRTVETELTSKQQEQWGEKGSDQRNTTNIKTQDIKDNVTSTTDNQTNVLQTEQMLHNDIHSATQQHENQSIRQRTGRAGYSPSDLIARYRETILNIDLRILNDLEPLFMGILEM